MNFPHKQFSRYGWKPDHHDARDMMMRLRYIAADLPPMVDLRAQCPPVYDQGNLGSCTANAIGAAHHFAQMNELPNPPALGCPQGLATAATMEAPFIPSRLFIYYNERSMEGTVGDDAGAEIRDGMKSVAAQGVCPETEWPYDPSQFAVKPAAQCYTDALEHQAIEYLRVSPDLQDIRAALAAGFPVVFGFTVYQSFESASVAQTGLMPMPSPRERILGGHAVLAVGYTDENDMLIVRNSWGAGWGMQGYFLMPYDVVNKNLASDFWTLRRVEAQ